MRKRIDLEYIFSSSVTILFSRLSTAPGLAEWFSDDVKHAGNIFTFVWDGIGEEAELVDMKKNSSGWTRTMRRNFLDFRSTWSL